MAEDTKIRIVSSADTKAIERAKKKVDELKQSTKGAGDATDALTQPANAAAGAVGALGSAVGIVNPKAGAMMGVMAHLTSGIKGVGMALKALMANPIVLFITGVVAAFAWWKSKMQEAKEAAASLYDKVTEGIRNAIAEDNRKIAASYDAMAHSISDAADKLQHLHEIQDMRRENDRARDDAAFAIERQTALAGATTADERAAINRSFDRRAAVTAGRREEEDARTDADRIYNDAVKDDFAKRRKQIEDEIESRKGDNGTLAQAKRLVKNAENTANGSFATTDEKKAAAEKSLPQLRLDLAAEEEKLKTLDRKLEDLKREEIQAQEKHQEAIKRIGIAQEKAKAEDLRLANEESFARQQIVNKIAEINKGADLTQEHHAVKLQGDFSSGGGFATAGAEAAAGAVATYLAPRKSEEQRRKQIELLTKQLEKLDAIARKGDGDEPAVFG